MCYERCPPCPDDVCIVCAQQRHARVHRGRTLSFPASFACGAVSFQDKGEYKSHIVHLHKPSLPSTSIPSPILPTLQAATGTLGTMSVCLRTAPQEAAANPTPGLLAKSCARSAASSTPACPAAATLPWLRARKLPLSSARVWRLGIAARSSGTPTAARPVYLAQLAARPVMSTTAIVSRYARTLSLPLPPVFLARSLFSKRKHISFFHAILSFTPAFLI